MVGELGCHRRGSLLPFAPQRGLWNGNAQRLMRAYEIEDRILQGEMAPQERALLRMRQGFTHQAPNTLARGEIVTVTVDRRIAPPTAAPERRVWLSPHAAPQYADACHADLAGDNPHAPAFSHRGNVHAALVGSQSANHGGYH